MRRPRAIHPGPPARRACARRTPEIHTRTDLSPLPFPHDQSRRGRSLPQQQRILTLPSPAAGPLAISLNAAVLYLAISLSGVIGGVVLGLSGAGTVAVIATGCVLAAAILTGRSGRAEVESRPARLERATDPDAAAGRGVTFHAVRAANVTPAALPCQPAGPPPSLLADADIHVDRPTQEET